jgi:hypothetical protein
MRLMIIVRASRAIILCLLERPAAWPRVLPRWRVCLRAACRGRDTGCDRRAYRKSAHPRGDFVDGPAQDTRRHNNAIHDYRYDRWFAPQRSELLLRHSLTILRGCLDASDTVRQAFEDN